MWLLVLITINFNLDTGRAEPRVEGWWTLNSMEECFMARDDLLVSLGRYNGHPPKGTQMICIDNTVDIKDTF